jgi:hypothetical protein
VELINWIWFAGAIASAAMLGIADAIEALWLALLWVTETLLAAMQFGRNWHIPDLERCPTIVRDAPSNGHVSEAAKSTRLTRNGSGDHQQMDFQPFALRHSERHLLSFAKSRGSVFHGCWPSIS